MRAESQYFAWGKYSKRNGALLSYEVLSVKVLDKN